MDNKTDFSKIPATETVQNREKANGFIASFRKLQAKHPKIFGEDALIRFALFAALIAVLGMIYSLAFNSFTSLYNWDYSWQYVNFSYYFWDAWHAFFKTGRFEFYSYSTYLGSDNIGSNSYYGLFDPFVLPIILFPRSWIPQLYALAAVAKAVCGSLCMRAYLKYMGIGEYGSRMGAIAYAFSGFSAFMCGFPSTISMAAIAPLVLLGIEKAIKERKILCLSISLALMGVISFFFLVTFCIWGVIYAIWRFFWTIKDRNAKENWAAIGMGVLGFAIGIALCAWTLLPSIRESSGSGRTISIGRAYLNSIVSALGSGDIGTVFSRLFEMVGDNPGREVMPLIGFFYPTCNFMWLPLAESSYDAWTSSLFCHTPIAIFFIFALITAVRKKDWATLIGTAACCVALFTTFPYYFFYAFAGDGYGRWFIVLIPEIILVACRGFDSYKEAPKWQFAAADAIEVAMTFATFFVAFFALSGKTFSPFNTADSYYPTAYSVPGSITEAKSTSLLWIVFYQAALGVAQGLYVGFFSKSRDRDSIARGLTRFIAVEAAVASNLSYNWRWPFSEFNGGPAYAEAATSLFSDLKAQDGGFYRCYSDTEQWTDNAMAFGYDGTRTFHSLYNRETKDFSLMTRSIGEGGYGKAYGQKIAVQGWSAFYGNKRVGADQDLGMKYYVLGKGEGKGCVETSSGWVGNVPLGAKLSYETDDFAVFENPNSAALGRGYDGGYYALGSVEGGAIVGQSNFYSELYGKTGFDEIMKADSAFLSGVVVDGGHGAVAPSKTGSGGFVDLSTDLTVQDIVLSADDLTDWTWDEAGRTVEGRMGTGTDLGRISDILATSPGVIVISKSDGSYISDDSEGAYFAISVESFSDYEIFGIGEKDGKEGQLLFYDDQMLKNYESSSEHGGLAYSAIYGFNSQGKTKEICIRHKGSGAYFNEQPFVYMMKGSDVLKETAKANDPEYALKNVEKKGDSFSFSTSFSKAKPVKTQIGYDKGWSLKAKNADGTEHSIDIYKADGGFVAFDAEAGDVSYVLSYETPYFKTGVYAAAGGAAILFAAETIRKTLKRKRRDDEGERLDGADRNFKHKEEFQKDAVRRPTAKEKWVI
jgi:hypothetical protein